MTKPLRSIAGINLGLSSPVTGGRLICPGGFISGKHGKQRWHPSPSKCAHFEDFHGTTLPGWLSFTEGTDAATSDGAVVPAAANGIYRLTAGDSAGTAAADQAQLAGNLLQWKASSGSLMFGASVALAAITTVTFFMGLTDTVALETPVEASGAADGITTTATDAVGVMFDTRMATDKWWMVGVKTDVDAVKQNSLAAPVAATYEYWEIQVGTDGSAVFYRNGLQIGTTMTGAVNPAIALTPVICIRPEGAVAGRTVDIDWVHVAANRA